MRRDQKKWREEMNQIFAIDTRSPLLCKNAARIAFRRVLRKILRFVSGRVARGLRDWRRSRHVEGHICVNKMSICTFHPQVTLNRCQTALPTLSKSAVICEIEVASLPTARIWVERHCLAVFQINGVREEQRSIAIYEATGKTEYGTIGVPV